MENYWWKWSFNTFLEAVATVHVFVASNNDVKLAETWTVRFAWLKSSSCFDSIKNSTSITRIAKFLSVCSLRPRPNFELFMKRTIWWVYTELNSWKDRRLAQLSSSYKKMSLDRPTRSVRLKIFSGTNVDLHMWRTKPINFMMYI